jgi:hypothetical protein
MFYVFCLLHGLPETFLEFSLLQDSQVSSLGILMRGRDDSDTNDIFVPVDDGIHDVLMHPIKPFI